MIGARLAELATLTSGLVEQIERNNAFIKIIEDRLTALRMGLAAWVSFKVDQTVHELGWAKPPGQDRWCLLVRDLSDENTTKEGAPVRRLPHCPLQVRACAMKQFPALLDALKEHAEEIAAAVQDAASIIEDIPGAAPMPAIVEEQPKRPLSALVEGEDPRVEEARAQRLADRRTQCRHTFNADGDCVRCGISKAEVTRIS